MFGIPSKKEINKLNSQLAELRQKSLTPTIHWLPSGQTVALFDFDDNDEIAKAIKTVPELASAVNYIGKAFSNGQYQIISNGKIIENHKILNLLNNPHPLYNSSEFMQTVAENLYSYGVTFVYKNKPGVEIKGLNVIPSNKCKAFVGNLTYKQFRDATDISEIIKYYEVTAENKKIEIPADEIFTVQLNCTITIKNKYLHFESPLKPLEKALQVPSAMYDTMQNLMNNGGMKGILSNKTIGEFGIIDITPDEQKKFQKAYKKYGGKSGQNDIALINKDVNYIPISSRIKDMLLPEQQKMIKTIIYDVLGIDAALLNSEDGKKYDNYGISRKSFYTETIMTGANNYAEALKKNLEIKEDLNIDYTYLDVFSENETEKAEKIATESQYIISLNESVKSGNMTRDNAIELLILNDYTEENAIKLIQ